MDEPVVVTPVMRAVFVGAGVLPEGHPKAAMVWHAVLPVLQVFEGDPQFNEAASVGFIRAIVEGCAARHRYAAALAAAKKRRSR